MLGGHGAGDDAGAVLETLLARQTAHLEEMLRTPTPVVAPAPAQVRGFRVRLDLRGTKPPVWRRLELPGDLTLPEVHDAIQLAMGWTDSHLHRFRTGGDYRSAYFITGWDVEEGEEGALEDEVRLDQLVTGKGDQLWYEYDFGDGWDHVLSVEEVLDEPPAQVRCTGGRGACPPEDCGGIGGYRDLAAWVRSDYSPKHLPDVFDDASHARDWLPLDWHPDRFDADEVNAALARGASAAVDGGDASRPVAVVAELGDLLDQLSRRGVLVLHEALDRVPWREPAELADAEAARVTRTYAEFLDVIGDGVRLTSAGYLPPAVVEAFAERSGISSWWIGKVNREDLTPPVGQVRDSARALGLVNVRKGQLTPTAVAVRCRADPQSLWRHVAARLPLGRGDFERQAGWAALAVAGSGSPMEGWRDEVSRILHGMGWRIDNDRRAAPPAGSPTLDVLTTLAGAARVGWRVTGTDQGVAATARAVIVQS